MPEEPGNLNEQRKVNVDRDQLKEQIIALLKPFTRRLPSNFVVKEEASLSKDLNINSADLVDLILEVESCFNIQVPDSTLPDLTTVGQIIDFVEKGRFAK